MWLECSPTLYPSNISSHKYLSKVPYNFSGLERLHTGPTTSWPLTDGSVWPWGRKSQCHNPARNHGERCGRWWSWWGGYWEWLSPPFTTPPLNRWHGSPIPPWGLVPPPTKWILPAAAPLGRQYISDPPPSFNDTGPVVPTPTLPSPPPLPPSMPPQITSLPLPLSLPLYPPPNPPATFLPSGSTVEGIFPHSRRAFGAVRHRILQLPLNIIFRRYQAIHWERNNVYGYVLSWGCYVVTQRDPLRHNILDGKSSRLRRIFVRGLVPPLHTVTDFLVEGGFRGQEGLNIAYGCLRPMP